MAQLKTIVVESIEIKGPYKNKYGESFMQILKDKETSYSKFTKTAAPLASQGESLQVLFEIEDKGKYKNNKIIEVSKTSLNNDVPFETKSSLKKEIKKIVNEDKPVLKALANTTTSKDISMEVSGLLQALVSTGHYTNPNDGSLNLYTLELALDLALKIKRKAASDLENQSK